jgi:hypothetical protein
MHGVGAGKVERAFIEDLEKRDGGPHYCGGAILISGCCGHPIETETKVITAQDEDVFKVNNARIQRSDWVFAYLDSFTAYGTFVEISTKREAISLNCFRSMAGVPLSTIQSFRVERG